MSAMTRRRFLAASTVGAAASAAQPELFERRLGRQLHASSLASAAAVQDWTMEGPGEVAFSDGWMRMWSPGEQMHHVFWCPATLPASFAAEWSCRNLHPEAGLCIVFFCAMGLNGKDVLDPSQPSRDGTFSQYHSGALRNYHISYYANTPSRPDRPHAHLRRNPGHKIVQEGPKGIVHDSRAEHRVRLMKDAGRILMWVDERPIVDWTDPDPHGAGRIALRQMQWTVFEYRDFKVWSVS